jgi:tricarballylate dehydrogenase
MRTKKQDIMDVLVIGDGIAGCMAALAAHREGANVLVLDKARSDVPHGNTAFCGGALRRVSREYPAKKYFSDIMKVSEGKADPELTRLTIRNSKRAKALLSRLGVRWTLPTSNPGRADSVLGRGVALAPILRDALRKAKIPVQYQTRVMDIALSNGTHAMVKARTGRGVKKILARAIVVSTGGFQADRRLVTQYIGKGAPRLVLRGYRGSTGDGHKLAMKIGAQLIGMDGYHGGIIHYGYSKYPEVGEEKGMRSVKRYEPGILVNRNGERFVDEGEDTADKTYAKFGRIIALTQPGGIAYLIFDSRAKNIVDPMYEGPEKEPVQAGSIEALAKKISLNASKLQETINLFNVAAVNGSTSRLKPPKTNFAQPIMMPPFYAYPVTGGMTFTFGGIRINSKAEVLNQRKKVIPGVFAAGEVTGGFFFHNYPAGSSLTRCAVFGEIAGKSAASYARRI